MPKKNKRDPLNDPAEENEQETKTAFENLGFTARKLDEEKKFKKGAPDFLFNRKNEIILCEVKTVHSAYNDDNLGHISMTMKPRKYPNEAIEIRQDKSESKIRPLFENSIRKRKAVIARDSSFANLPYLVAFFFDDLAGDFLSLQLIIADFPEVSACINLLPNCEYKAALRKIPHELLEKIIDGEIPNPVTPEKKGKHWHFVLNPKAHIRFDPGILGLCPYDSFFHEDS